MPGRSPRWVRRACLPAVLPLALVLASCSSSPTKQGTRPTASTTTTSVLTPAILSKTVVLNGHTYAMPSEDGVHAIDPSVATGGQIVLTNKGFLPYRLFVQLKQVVTFTNLSSIERAWYEVDADGAVLGRLATEVARVLRGKHKPIFAPHVDTGDHVIVVNAAKIVR
jgi:hypothetical protein